MQKLFFISKFGRRAQRRPIGLIASTLIFSIFLFFFILLLLHIYHEYTHPLVFIHTNEYPNLSLFKIPISLFKRHSSVSKIDFRYNSSFHHFKFSKHPFLISSLINYEVSSNFSKSSKSQPKLFKQVLNSSNHTNLSPKNANFGKINMT